jgi:hypothetical protein
MNQEHPYTKVIFTLLTQLVMRGFQPVEVCDDPMGMEDGCMNRTPTAQAAADAILAVDESILYVNYDYGAPKPYRAWIYIVLGNEPECTVADHGCPVIPKVAQELEWALERFSEIWENCSAPVIAHTPDTINPPHA